MAVQQALWRNDTDVISLASGVFTLTQTLTVAPGRDFLRLSGQGPGKTVLDCGGVAGAINIQHAGHFAITGMSIANCVSTALVFNLLGPTSPTKSGVSYVLNAVTLEQLHIVNCTGFPAGGAWVVGAAVNLTLVDVTFEGNSGKGNSGIAPAPCLDRGGAHTLLAELYHSASSVSALHLSLLNNGRPAGSSQLLSTLGLHMESGCAIPQAYLPPDLHDMPLGLQQHSSVPQLSFLNFTASGNWATQFSAAHISCNAGCAVTISKADITDNVCEAPQGLGLGDTQLQLQQDATQQDQAGRLGFKLRRPAALAVLGTSTPCQPALLACTTPLHPTTSAPLNLQALAAGLSGAGPSPPAAQGSSLWGEGLLVQGNQGGSGMLVGSTWWVQDTEETRARVGSAAQQPRVWDISLQLHRSLIADNVAAAGLGGAGLTLLGIGAAQLLHMQFLNNSVPGLPDPEAPDQAEAPGGTQQPWAEPAPFGFAGSGAALYAELASSALTLAGSWSPDGSSSCTIAGSASEGICGAVVILGANQTVTVDSCALRDNLHGCGMMVQDAALSLTNSSLTFTNCLVQNHDGGHPSSIIYVDSAATLGVLPALASAAMNNTLIANTTFRHNMHGALYAIGTTLSDNTLTMDNCVFENNHADQAKSYSDSMAIMERYSRVSVRNTRVHRNLLNVSANWNSPFWGGTTGLKCYQVKNALFYKCSFKENRNKRVLIGSPSFAAALNLDGVSAGLILQSTFEDNLAYGGGGAGLAVGVNTQVALMLSSFTNNSARPADNQVAGLFPSLVGGAMRLDPGSRASITACNFTANSAVIGGAIHAASGASLEIDIGYMHANGPGFGRIRWLASEFQEYVSRWKNSPEASTPTAFWENKAVSGGAIAASDIGALQFASDSYFNMSGSGRLPLTLLHSNTALSGGAITLSRGPFFSTMSGVYVCNTIIDSNVALQAQHDVDALAALLGIDHATANGIASSMACGAGGGGGVCLVGAQHSDVAFFGNVSFTNNQAAYGGGLYVTTNTQLCGLLPDSCGRFKVVLAGYFNRWLDDILTAERLDTAQRDNMCHFSNNSALGGTGSAVYSDLPVGVSINCGEDTVGGIASLQPCPSWNGSVLQATYPAAPRSALATRHLRAVPSEELQAPLPPAQPEDERGLVATSGLSLQVSPQQLLNFTPDDNIVLWVACQDAFGLPLAYQYPSGSGSDVLACQASTNLSLNNAILYGQTSTQVTLSVASASVPAFTSLKLRLMPGTQQAITISCSISSRQRTLPPSTVMVRARPCRINEVVSDAMDACVRCDVGFVALLPSGSCQACPDQALCNTVDSNAVDNDTATGIIVPRDGMWHSSPFAMELYPCPNPQTCSAAGRSALLTAYQAQLVRNPSSYNYTTWNQLMCATGYQGNFCGSCAQGYGLTRPAHCVRCTSKSSYDMLYFILSSLLVVVPLVLALRASLNESGMMLKKSKEAEVEEPQELMAFDRLRTCASRFIKHSSVKSRDQSSCSQLIDSLNGSVTRYPMTSPPASNNVQCPSAAVDGPTSCSQAAFLIASPMAQDKEPSNAQQTSPAHLLYPSTTDIKPIEHKCGHHASSLGLATSAGVEMHQVQTPDMEDSARSYAADDFGRTMGPATPARAQPQPSSTLSKQLVDWRPPPGMHIQWSRGWGPDSVDANEAADVQCGQAVAEGGREQEEPAHSHLHPYGRQESTTLLRRLPSPLAVGDVELDLMGSLPTSWGGAFPPSPDEQRPSAQTRVKFNPVIETHVQPTQSEADHQSSPKDNALPDKDGDDGGDAAGLVSPLLKVLVTYLQVACMVRYAPLKLPKVVEFIIDIAVTASTVPGSAVSLDCALPSGGHLSKATQRTLVSFFTPMALLAIVLLIFTVLHTMQRSRTTKGEAIRGEDKITDEVERLPHARGSAPKQKQNEASSQAEDIARSLWLRLVIATNTTVFVFFPSTVTSLFNIFSCVKGDELSDSSLIASLHLAPGTRLNLPGTLWNMDMEQQCFQGAHRTLALSLGIPGLLFIAGGIPIASAWYLALHSVEQRESDVQLRACWMFMYADYRTCRFFWESVVMLRKVVIAAAMVFLAITDIGLQVATSAIIVLLFLFLHLAARPYNNELLNKLELLSQAVVLTNLLLSAYLTYPTTSQNWLLPYVLSMFILVLNMLVVCTFVWYLVLAMRDTLLYQAGLRHSDAVHLNIKGLTHAMQAEYGRFSPLTARLLRIGLHLPSNLPQRIFTAGKRILRFLLRCGAPAVDYERSPQPKITLQGVHRSTTFNRRRASTIASLMDSSSTPGTLPRYPSSLALSRSQSQATAHSSVSGNLSP